MYHFMNLPKNVYTWTKQRDRGWFAGSWEAYIIRKRRFWFSKTIGYGAGWSETEALTNAVWRAKEKGRL